MPNLLDHTVFKLSISKDTKHAVRHFVYHCAVLDVEEIFLKIKGDGPKNHHLIIFTRNPESA